MCNRDCRRNVAGVVHKKRIFNSKDCDTMQGFKQFIEKLSCVKEEGCNC